ncbi:hypothetical protein DPMN_011672 [Dreissena polymorpha]|uniref:MAM domain-containing protein n=1 Tax=Dreissena polymorpha TaxID=45954 RepID=A0A9D4S089_DREPO|nr:hypothetical protein DPMN_011672 [Dreissena polymorpha]
MYPKSLGVTTSAPGVTNTPAVGNLGARACSFEQPTICGYTQSTSDQFDWTFDSAGTTTIGTGPALDHTYNTPQGWCMSMILLVLESKIMLTFFILFCEI